MTLLEQVLSKKALATVDRYRSRHGIRSRKKALEMMLEESIPEHPFEVALRNAPKLPKGSVPKEILEQLKQAEIEPRISLAQAMQQRKPNKNAP